MVPLPGPEADNADHGDGHPPHLPFGPGHRADEGLEKRAGRRSDGKTKISKVKNSLKLVGFFNESILINWSSVKGFSTDSSVHFKLCTMTLYIDYN